MTYLYRIQNQYNKKYDVNKHALPDKEVPYKLNNKTPNILTDKNIEKLLILN